LGLTSVVPFEVVEIVCGEKGDEINDEKHAEVVEDKADEGNEGVLDHVKEAVKPVVGVGEVAEEGDAEG